MDLGSDRRHIWVEIIHDEVDPGVLSSNSSVSLSGFHAVLSITILSGVFQEFVVKVCWFSENCRKHEEIWHCINIAIVDANIFAGTSIMKVDTVLLLVIHWLLIAIQFMYIVWGWYSFWCGKKNKLRTES